MSTTTTTAMNSTTAPGSTTSPGATAPSVSAPAKVMSRAQRRPGVRPPGRRDPRRPGGAPPRTRPADGRPVRVAEQAPGTPRGLRAGAPDPVRAAANTLRQPRPTDVFAERLLAVLSGQRPVHWMLRHTVGPAYDDLARLAERGTLRTRGARPVVRDVGYCEPRPGAVEAFARIAAGEQVRAMAFRLEQGADLRWRCTAVELGGPRPHGTGRGGDHG